MKSFIVSTIIILGAYGFIYGINKLFYRYSVDSSTKCEFTQSFC